MNCVIPGANLKVFGKSIHSLARIGEELYLEPLEQGLALRTVNSSRSAYACFVFAPSFFYHYDDGSGKINSKDEDDDDSLRCKIGMKSCLTVFKSLATLEKTVDKCKINLNMEEARLIIQFYCRHGIVKTHNLAFIECETLQAVFSKELCPNVLVAHSKVLSEAAANFQNNQEEVTLTVDPNKVSFKNYVEDEPDPTKVIHTELTLAPDEFDSFQVGVDTGVTFCLKELRAILSFSEISNLPLGLHFESPGKPVVFSINSDPAFEANFVLATLADQSSQVSCSQNASQIRNNSRNLSTRISQTTPAVKRTSAPPGVRQNGYLDQTKMPSTSTDRASRKRPSEKLDAAFEELMDDDELDATMVQMCDAVTVTKAASDDSPVIPLQAPAIHSTGNESQGDRNSEEDEDEDDDDELVPGTPPEKKFKSIFFGTSQSTTSSQTPAPLVLAEDTDEEDT